MKQIADRFTSKQKRNLARILSAAVLLGAACFVPVSLPVPMPFPIAVFLIPYVVAGWDVVWRAVRNIGHGQIFDEHFLMSLATLGAFAIGEYAEAVFVMLFYQVGELFQDYAVGSSRQSIAELMDIRPDSASVEQPDGSLVDMDPEDVPAGSVIVVRPGERIPLDGVILTGSTSLDTAALTGEALPRDAGPGDDAVSGCVNLTGVLRIETTRTGDNSTVARVLELVENAEEKKAVSEQFITRFARWYTPAVVAAAAALAILPPVFLGNHAEWFRRALNFLVVSCPCALVISVPLGFFGGIGGASRRGILIKGGAYLEALAKTETAVFDKTGTLTQGSFIVTGVQAADSFHWVQVLEAAARAEAHSRHPIAQSLRESFVDDSPETVPAVTDVEEAAGYGVRATVEGRRICVGSRRMMAGLEIPESRGGAEVYVSIDGVYAGRIFLSDVLKADARAAVSELRKVGVQRTVMLTGDGERAAWAAANTVGVDEYYAGLLPEDKVELLEELLAEKRSGSTLCFVGDGVNDAPVLARADVGIAMGALGSDAAIEAADVVLMDDRPSKIALAIRISRRTLRIVRENVAFALLVKGLVLILSAAGYAAMWAAVFADVGVAVLAILNSMRCLKTR